MFLKRSNTKGDVLQNGDDVLQIQEPLLFGSERRGQSVGDSWASRRITAILYLNEAWQEDKGGALRCYGDGDHVEALGRKQLEFGDPMSN